MSSFHKAWARSWSAGNPAAMSRSRGSPVYTPVYNEQKEITDIKVEYGEAYDAQMLRYSRDYATLPYCNE